MRGRERKREEEEGRGKDGVARTLVCVHSHHIPAPAIHVAANGDACDCCAAAAGDCAGLECVGVDARVRVAVLDEDVAGNQCFRQCADRDVSPASRRRYGLVDDAGGSHACGCAACVSQGC